MTTKTTTTVGLTAVLRRNRVTVVSGAYTHRATTPNTAGRAGLDTVTACGITVDPILTRRGEATEVDCPYCQGRRSRFESKAAR